MKRNIIHGFLLLVSMVIITACGTDQKENPPEPAGPYSFFNATTPVRITQMGTSSCGSGTCPDRNNTSDNNTTGTIISVQLLEFGLGIPGEIVRMKPFDHKYGFVSNSVVATDVNGNANFIYNAPEDYNAVRGQDVTIQAIYLDPRDGNTTTSNPTEPNILLTQDFVLQFR